MSDYELKQLRGMLEFLMVKMSYDREQNLTHAQRNMNDDWNVGYVSYCLRKVNRAIPDEDDKNGIPF